MEKSTVMFLGNNQIIKPVSGCNIALTGYTANAGFEDWHSHTNASISFLLNGTHHEDILGKNHKRLPGDIKFVPAGELHRCNNYSPGTRKINLELSDNLIAQMDIGDGHIEQVMKASPKTKFSLLKLYHELDDTANHATISAQLILYELFCKDKPGKKKPQKSLPCWAMLLKDILNEEWNEKFDLNDIAARIGVHPVTISKYFPLYFASTLGVYIKNIKIEKALSLIKTTALSLTEIAYACGFADQAHFTRTFKEITGFLPKEYRKF